MKNVLITGASRGIGAAAARKFAREGYNIVLNYNKGECLANKLREEIISMGAGCIAVRADVANSDEVKKMFDVARREFGKINVLVNNAGIALPQGLFTDFTSEDYHRVFDINVYGMMNCSREAIPDFISEKSGKIINISSVWGVSGGSCEVIYSASKAAVVGFTKALAKELAPSGINVNCIAPGMIETDMNSHLSCEDMDLFRQEIPMGRIGMPEDVANVIYFLASESSAYITGQVLNVDGGLI